MAFARGPARAAVGARRHISTLRLIRITRVWRLGQFVAQGNFLGWQYTISQGERVVATLSKQGFLPSSFEVDTVDGQHDLFLLCLVLSIEQIHRERRRRRGAASQNPAPAGPSPLA
jgi:hypothetical protein